ncbi:hypothetical protein SN11_02605 [Vibrio harveyi]|nr:hypothetical protein SN11_02605 [Vibrio harveyi]
MIYKVYVYLDEYSLSKIRNKEELLSYILDFIKSTNLVKKNRVNLDLSRSNGYMQTVVSGDLTLFNALSDMVPSDLRVRFKKLIFDKDNSIWSDNQIHSSNDYYDFNGDCVTDGCLAEISERKLNNYKGLLVFLWQFENIEQQIKVTKEESVDIVLDTLKSSSDIASWMEEEFDISEFNYDFEVKFPPTDKQTYLRDSNIYIKTEKLNQGRSVYQCMLTQMYHTVDNCHYSHKAHVEVWDRHGTYLGECDLQGKLNQDIPKDKKRKKDNPVWL